MKRYLIINQHWRQVINAKELTNLAQTSPLKYMKDFYLDDKLPNQFFGEEIYEILPDNSLVLVTKDWDTSD